MRNTARWAITLGLTATAVCAPSPGPRSPPRRCPVRALRPLCPGAHRRQGRQRGDRHTGTRGHPDLCAGPSGTHPAAGSACVELAAVGGDLSALTRVEDAMCPMVYDPVLVTVDGVWQGKRVSYERVFSNDCEMNAHGSSVFSF